MYAYKLDQSIPLQLCPNTFKVVCARFIEIVLSFWFN